MNINTHLTCQYHYNNITIKHHNSQYEKYLSTFFLIIKIVRENGLQENETDE